MRKLTLNEALVQFRNGEQVFAACQYGHPEWGIFPLENETEIRELSLQLYCPKGIEDD